MSDAQNLDGLDENETMKRYMHHYNFPSYSVGETKPSRGPGRREIGHGALAETCSGSCASDAWRSSPMRSVPYLRLWSPTVPPLRPASAHPTLSLMAAGVPIKTHGSRYLLRPGNEARRMTIIMVLTDIQGLEDFFGDMDFKVGWYS